MFFFCFLVSAHEYYKKDAYRQVKDKFIDISHSQLRPQSFQFTPPVYLENPCQPQTTKAGLQQDFFSCLTHLLQFKLNNEEL